MPRSPSVPSYRLHKPTGQAVVTIRTPSGGRRDLYLGKYNTAESRQSYGRIIAEISASPSAVPASCPGGSSGLTIDQVLLPFWRWAQVHYRAADGQPTSEIESLSKAVAPLRKLYGQLIAAEFGPKKLAVVRKQMIDAGLSRGVINRSIGRIKRIFKWATAEELIPPGVYQGLQTLVGLRAGRTEAPDRAPVMPVNPAHVEKTLPHLNKHTSVMVELQRMTGMRPGEICRLTWGQIERDRERWLYRPRQHKTAHHGKERVIPLGPRVRARLLGFIVGDKPPPAGFEQINLADAGERVTAAAAFQEAGRDKDAALLRDLGRSVAFVAGCVVDPSQALFSPKRAREELYRELRAKRKSKVPPSQQNRKSKRPLKKLGEVYTTMSYAKSVMWAAQQAGVPHWHPNQLRHLFATEVRRAHGLEAAQVLLGHSRADVTQIYAERNLALATRIAAAIG